MSTIRSAWRVHDSVFIGNYARTKGGGIHSAENIHQAVVTRSQFRSNVVDPYEQGEGAGGIYVWQVGVLVAGQWRGVLGRGAAAGCGVLRRGREAAAGCWFRGRQRDAVPSCCRPQPAEAS
jgi:predicted outer membrane repeat protein